MKLKYKCLILDHDDTAVDSTLKIHYPIFIKTMETFRPGEEILTFEQFMRACFYPGLMDYYTKCLGFTPEECKLEYHMWRDEVAKRSADFYAGLPEILEKYRTAGGVICVSSQSHREIITRDYKSKLGFEPDYIYGSELGEKLCKPATYTVTDVCQKCKIDVRDVLVVDDLRTGLEMAKSAGADFAAAGWSHCVDEIIGFMKANSKYYLEKTSELEAMLFE